MKIKDTTWSNLPDGNREIKFTIEPVMKLVQTVAFDKIIAEISSEIKTRYLSDFKERIQVDLEKKINEELNAEKLFNVLIQETLKEKIFK